MMPQVIERNLRKLENHLLGKMVWYPPDVAFVNNKRDLHLARQIHLAKMEIKKIVINLTEVGDHFGITTCVALHILLPANILNLNSHDYQNRIAMNLSMTY